MNDAFGPITFQAIVNGYTGEVAGERPTGWVKAFFDVIRPILIGATVFVAARSQALSQNPSSPSRVESVLRPGLGRGITATKRRALWRGGSRLFPRFSDRRAGVARRRPIPVSYRLTGVNWILTGVNGLLTRVGWLLTRVNWLLTGVNGLLTRVG